ncbi:MAG: glycosyltransferase family 39 protein [Acidobacteriota bacterium]
MPPPSIETQDLNDRMASLSRRAVRFSGWSYGMYGLVLVPGADGVLVLTVDLPAGQAAFLSIWLYRPTPAVSNTISVSDDGVAWRVIARDVHRLGAPLLTLGGAQERSRRIWVRVTASDREPAGSPERLILDQLQLRCANEVPGWAHPRVFALFFGLIAVFVAGRGSPATARRLALRLGAAAALCAAAAAWPAAMDAPANRILVEGRPVLFAAAAAAAAILLAMRRPARWRAASSVLALLALSLAAWSRWLAWQTDAKPFAPDADVFRSIASAPSGWFATAREPLFVWLLRGAYAAAGPTEAATRFTSLLIGLAFVAAVYGLGRRLFGASAGLVAALFLAVHPGLSTLSVEGLRDELFALLLCLFCVVLLPRTVRSEGWRTAALALLLSAMVLTRLNAIVPAFLVLVVFGLLRRGPAAWRNVLVPTAIAILAVAPFLVSCRSRFGDPFYALNIYATGFRNLEFAGRPGFPSRAAVAANLFAGPLTTTGRYVFGLHTPAQVGTHIARGYGRALFGYWASTPGFFPGASGGVFWIYVAGIPLLLLRWRSRDRRRSGRRLSWRRPGVALGFVLCVFLGPVSFLAGAAAFRLDWRILSFLLIGYSVAVASAAALAVRLVRWARRAGRPRSGPARPEAIGPEQLTVDPIEIPQ